MVTSLTVAGMEECVCVRNASSTTVLQLMFTIRKYKRCKKLASASKLTSHLIAPICSGNRRFSEDCFGPPDAQRCHLD